MCYSVTSDSAIKPLSLVTSNTSAIVKKKAQIREIHYKRVMFLKRRTVVTVANNAQVPNATDCGQNASLHYGRFPTASKQTNKQLPNVLLRDPPW